MSRCHGMNLVLMNEWKNFGNVIKIRECNFNLQGIYDYLQTDIFFKENFHTCKNRNRIVIN